MAVNGTSMDRASITYCYERDSRRNADGEFMETETLLPWALLRFGDAAEERVYVIPSDPNAIGLKANTSQYLPGRKEYMRFKPFPHESDRPATGTASGDLAKPGPVGVHFLNNI